MTIYEFISLKSMDEKAEAVWCGHLIAERAVKRRVILLFWVHSFFVEVYYDQDDNQIKKFAPFKSTRKLDPYLAKIQLEASL